MTTTGARPANDAYFQVEAPVLVDFWLENFKLQVGAHSAELHLDMKGAYVEMTYNVHALTVFTGEPPTKRRRVRDPVTEPFGLDGGSPPRRGHEFAMDVDQPMDFEMGFGDFREYACRFGAYVNSMPLKRTPERT